MLFTRLLCMVRGYCSWRVPLNVSNLYWKHREVTVHCRDCGASRTQTGELWTAELSQWKRQRQEEAEAV